MTCDVDSRAPRRWPDAHAQSEVFAIDRIPEWVRVVGRAAFDRREPAVRVADLSFDSLMARVDAPANVRLLRFGSMDNSVVVQAAKDDGGVTISITIRPATSVGIDVRPLHGRSQRVWSDDSGCATCRSVAHGPLSLLVHWPTSAGGPVRTAWVQV